MKLRILLQISCVLGLLYFLPGNFIAEAQSSASVEVKANLRHAHHLFEKGDYEGAVSKLERVLSFDANNKEAKDLLYQCNQRVEQQRQAREKAELDAFTNAKNVGSKYALNAFISSYPNSKYAPDARAMIEDYDLWMTAQQINTTDSYQNYLRISSNRSYAQEAEKRISEIESEQMWLQVRASRNESTLSGFVNKYPESPHVTEANRIIHELKGEKYYSQGDLTRAYTEFISAGGRAALSWSNQKSFDRALDYHNYISLDKSNEYACKAFLATYPNSEYRSEVSNSVARAMGRQINMYSSDSYINEALRFAQDEATREYVRNQKQASKKAYKEMKRRERHNRIMANGGYVGFGIDLFDLGMNVLTSKEEERTFNLMYYNIPLTFRIGNFKTPVYLELAVRPGFVIANDLYDYYDTDDYGNKYFFHLPLSAKLKINLFRPWGDSKFYINGAGYYNAIRKKEFETEFSVGGGIGVTNRHWDWQILYYRQDIDKDKIFNKKDLHYLGTSLGYFF